MYFRLRIASIHIFLEIAHCMQYPGLNSIGHVYEQAPLSLTITPDPVFLLLDL